MRIEAPEHVVRSAVASYGLSWRQKWQQPVSGSVLRVVEQAAAAVAAAAAAGPVPLCDLVLSH